VFASVVNGKVYESLVSTFVYVDPPVGRGFLVEAVSGSEGGSVAGSWSASIVWKRVDAAK
jgi:hypothetical protein